MCHWRATKFSCTSCNNEVKDEHTAIYPFKRIKCPTPERCNVLDLPTAKWEILEFKVFMCNPCAADFFASRANPQDSLTENAEVQKTALNQYPSYRSRWIGMCNSNFDLGPEPLVVFLDGARDNKKEKSLFETVRWQLMARSEGEMNERYYLIRKTDYWVRKGSREGRFAYEVQE